MSENINSNYLLRSWYMDGLSEFSGANLVPAKLTWDYNSGRLVLTTQPPQQNEVTIFNFGSQDIEKVHLSTSQVIVYSKHRNYTLESTELLNTYAHTYTGGAKLRALFDATEDLRNSPEAKDFKKFLKQYNIKLTRFHFLRTLFIAVIILFATLAILIVLLNFISKNNA